MQADCFGAAADISDKAVLPKTPSIVFTETLLQALSVEHMINIKEG